MQKESNDFSSKNKTYFYLFVFAILGLTVYILWPVKDLILISWVVITIFMPVYRFFAEKLRFNKIFATLFSVLAVSITILFPVSMFINYAISQFVVFYNDINTLVQGDASFLVNLFTRVNEILARIPFVEYRLSIENAKIVIMQNITPVANFILGISVDIGVSFAESLPLVIVFMYLLWFGFAEHDRILNLVRKISPLSEKLDDLYISRITAMIVGIVKGTFVIALLQGGVAGLSFALTGVPYSFFWTTLLVFISVLPLGTSFATIPVAIAMMLLGNVWGGDFHFSCSGACNIEYR